MTNKIIEAARLAGFRTGNITLSGEGVAPIPFIVPVSATNCQHELSRFYALARAEALEDAAQAVKSLTAEIRFQAIEHYKFADAAEKTIHALKEQDAAIAAGKGEA